jgi:hypothetical protein
MRRHIQIAFLAVAMAACGVTAAAQDAGPQPGGEGRQRGQGGGQFAGMQRVTGTIVSVAGDAITVKAEDGTVSQVTTTVNTRVMKGQGVTAKVADLKPGDGVMAVGNLDAPNKTLHAALLMVTDAEQLKKLRENLGKTYISGKVTAIDGDNLKLTVMRPDGVAQTIGFDETTSFKRGARVARGGGIGTGAAPVATEGGESITLADIKVGDNVTGQGSIKGGVFIPGQLNVAAPRAPRGDGARPGNPAGPGNAAPAAIKPQQ